MKIKYFLILTLLPMFFACGEDDPVSPSNESSSSVEPLSSQNEPISSQNDPLSSAEELLSSSSTQVAVIYGPNQQRIPSAGATFNMGSNLNEIYSAATDGEMFKNLIMDNGTLEDQVHPVSFTYDFMMDETEVTQLQVINTLTAANQLEILNTLQSGWASANNVAHMPMGDNIPANVSVPYVVAVYANARSTLEGYTPAYIINDANYSFTTDYSATGYRLPTEAEWEFAARGGTTTDFYWGGTFSMPLSETDSALISQYAVWKVNSSDLGYEAEGYGANEVASKLPNAYNLYDMSGNLSEFVNEKWDWNEYPSTAVTDPKDTTTFMNNMDAFHKRGGNWMSEAMFLRSSNRTYNFTVYKEFAVGFRLVRANLAN